MHGPSVSLREEGDPRLRLGFRAEMRHLACRCPYEVCSRGCDIIAITAHAATFVLNAVGDVPWTDENEYRRVAGAAVNE